MTVDVDEFEQLYPAQGIDSIIDRSRSVPEVLESIGPADLYPVEGGMVIRPYGERTAELATLPTSGALH